MKKSERLYNNEYLSMLLGERFNEHLDLFTFPKAFWNYCDIFIQILLM